MHTLEPQMKNSMKELNEKWFKATSVLGEEPSAPALYPLTPNDPEVRLKPLRTVVTTETPFSQRFEKFSSWKNLVIGVTRLRKRFKRDFTPLSVTDLEQGETAILQLVQKEHFPKASRGKSTCESALRRLQPSLGEDGLLRVGGRLQMSSLDDREKHPVILPKSHVSKLIASHVHVSNHHSGRLMTAGAIRNLGYWILGGQRLVNHIIHYCVICRRLRGATSTPAMASLPYVRANPTSPFTEVALDCFGPWGVVHKRTRGFSGSTKRWGLIFTCMYSRGIHIEMLETMSTNSFLCALRRFIAIRGKIATIFSDIWSNFLGAKSQLKPEIDAEEVRKYAREQGIIWKFNPPHASHWNGVIESQIRTVRKALDAMFLQFGDSQLTSELLSTFFAEVVGIVNSRPLTAVSTDPDSPEVLSPAMLLTGKSRPLVRPEGEFVPEDMYARRWWRRTQYLAEQFWVRWRREYLNSLQTRQKWDQEKRFKWGCGTR